MYGYIYIDMIYNHVSCICMYYMIYTGASLPSLHRESTTSYVVVP